VPTYQYACTACGEELEAVQSFTDAALTECPACGGALRKVFSAVGVVFKGSGFYKTDSRKGTGDKPTGDKPTGDAAPKTETAAKTESAKPAESKPANTTTTTPAAKSA
jgi:putative FmdB family regulatory protein